MAIPAEITQLIEGVLHGKGPYSEDLPECTARQHGAIPLMGDIGGLWMMKSDGSIYELAWDSDEPPTPLPDEKRVQALAAGLQRYPWLASLLPPITRKSFICSTCRGQGRIRLSANRALAGFLCPDCNGLGWSVFE